MQNLLKFQIKKFGTKDAFFIPQKVGVNSVTAVKREWLHIQLTEGDFERVLEHQIEK